MRSSISRMVSYQGDQLIRATPTAIVISLISAALLPHVLALAGGEHAVSTAVAMAGPLKLLGDLGLAATAGFIPGLVDRLRDKSRGRKTPTEEEIRQQLEKELLDQWHAGGQSAAALRQEASRLLQAIQGVEAALAGATGDVRQSLAQGLAELGGTFDEFRWILDELKTTLAEIRNEQAVQLALQKEQLGLQREQLVKTNLLLRLQQSTAPLQTTVSPAVTGFEEEIPPADVPCPYKGLASFEPEDADYFFGREELVAELNTRLAETRFLAVVGPSGSGKSSVVRAGLIPAIWRGELPGSQNWKTVLLSPGQHPLEELAIRIALLSGVAAGSLVHDLESDERGLHLAVRQVLAKEPDHVRFVLVIDQFEELFALCQDENERRHFIEVVLRACQSADSRMILVLAIRADFYGRCAAYPALASSLQDNQVLVGPLSEVELCQAIEQPAVRVGLTLEPGLVETILTDVGGSPGALPLLSHALLETWNRRRGYTLTIHGYLESGGVEGSIARTADRVYEERLSPDHQAVARDIFLRLTAIGEGTLETRRRAKREELFPRAEDRSAVEVVLKTLVDARLVTASEDTVEVAHEALIRQWPRLRKWLEEDREGLRLHRHLTEAADEWVRLDRDPGALYRGARLAAATEWAQDHISRLNRLEREFLESSQALEVDELKAERRRSARLRRRGFSLAGALLLALGLACVTTFFYTTIQAQSITNKVFWEMLASRLVALEAMQHVDDQSDVALLLSIEAGRIAPSPYAEEALFTALQEVTGLGSVFESDADRIWSLAFSPDSKILASASGSNKPRIILWDVESGLRLGHPLTCPSDSSPTDIAFSSDGKALASAQDDGTILLWDVAAGELLKKLSSGEYGPGLGLAFGPDGREFASSHADGTVVLWDVGTGQPIGESMHGHAHSVLSIAFSPDGTMLASGSRDGEIIIWDVETHLPLGGSLKIPQPSPIDSLTFTAGHLWSLSPNRIDTWEVGTHDLARHPGFELRYTGAIPPAIGIAGSAYGRVATYHADGIIVLWDSTGTPIGQLLPRHTDPITSLASTPGTKMLASGDMNGRLIIWDIDPESWVAEACRIANRSLTTEEWKDYIPLGSLGATQPYHKTCPDIP